MKVKTQIKIHDITQVAAVVCLYIILTVALPVATFGMIQFRIAECLNFLVIYRKKYAVGLILGVFVANLFSPYVLDVVFGTAHTLLAVVLCNICFRYLKKRSIQYGTTVMIFSTLMFIVAIGINLSSQGTEVFIPIYATLFVSEFLMMTLGAFIMYPICQQLKLDER